MNLTLKRARERDATKPGAVRRENTVDLRPVTEVATDLAAAPSTADRIEWPGRPVHGEMNFKRFYIPSSYRAVAAVVMGAVWSLLSLYLARHWIADLGKVITLPLAIVVIEGIALVPGYLNMQLLISLLLDRPPALTRDSDLHYPEITVLVAAFNEEERMKDTLDSIAAQTYPGEVSVMVIDDGSTDDTADVVTQLIKSYDRGPIQLMTVPHGGKALALNAGLAQVETPLSATVDADTVLLPDTLRRAVTRLLLSGKGTSAVAGSVLVNNWRANILTRMQRWEYALGIASVKRVQALYQATLVAQGAFSIYVTDDLKQVNGWPDLIGEDIVMTWSLLAKGDRVAYEPSAVVLTGVPEHFHSFVRQRRRWARGMIEGLRAWGGTVVQRRWLARHGVIVDYMLPFVDLTYTFAFLPGVVLAIGGNFLIVGPMTLAVLPLGLLMLAIMALRQRDSLQAIGFKRKSDFAGLLLYFLISQAMLAPVSLSGYFQEFFGTKRRW
ncbi:MAG: glycosyltransferase family 2 protein [Actinobacteria bacterium]|nr:glycosyltransferase family 2 protein [Actinomycetota bacterium]